MKRKHEQARDGLTLRLCLSTAVQEETTAIKGIIVNKRYFCVWDLLSTVVVVPTQATVLFAHSRTSMPVPFYVAILGLLNAFLSHVSAQQCIIANRCDCRKFTCGVVSTDKPQSGLTGPRMSFLSAQYQHGGKCDDSPYPGPVLPGGRFELNVGNEEGVLFVGRLPYMCYSFAVFRQL